MKRNKNVAAAVAVAMRQVSGPLCGGCSLRASSAVAPGHDLGSTGCRLITSGQVFLSQQCQKCQSSRKLRQVQRPRDLNTPEEAALQITSLCTVSQTRNGGLSGLLGRICLAAAVP